MHRPIHRTAVDLLLAAMFQESETGGQMSFMFSKPGQPRSMMSGGTELYIQSREMVRTVLHVRQHGPAYLKFLSIDDIRKMLSDFIVENYGYLAPETFLSRFSGSYVDHVSDGAKNAWADAMASSSIFAPADELTLFPLVAVRVADEFLGQPLSFIPARKVLGPDVLPAGLRDEWFFGDQFPPSSDWKHRRRMPVAWLGVRAPSHLAAIKMKASILGALALTQPARYRYRCSGRDDLFGGWCVIADRASFSLTDPHTPPLMDDIVITASDAPWLAIMAGKLADGSKAVRRQLHALEYYYRAWFLDEHERYPIHCMTLDAVFGDANQSTQAVVEGVKRTLGAHVADDRLRMLMELRASVIHGGAPDVYDSRKYARYYDRYETDPIRDLELVVAECLRVSIFGGAIAEHADPHADKVAKLQAAGKLPKDLHAPSILDGARVERD